MLCLGTWALPLVENWFGDVRRAYFSDGYHQELNLRIQLTVPAVSQLLSETQLSSKAAVRGPEKKPPARTLSEFVSSMYGEAEQSRFPTK